MCKHPTFKYRIKYREKRNNIAYDFAESEEAKLKAEFYNGEIQRRAEVGRFVTERW